MPQALRNVNVVIAIAAVIAIVTHLVLRFVVITDAATIPLYVIVLVGGAPLVWSLLKDVAKLQFGADLLAGISIVTAALLDEWLAGAIVVLMLSGGEALESYAVRRAGSLLDALARRMPSVAHRRDGEEIVDIAVDEVAVGDELVVLPHEICPVDGIVVAGHGAMDESYLTGEPYQVRKTPGVQVLSGAINGEAALTVRAEKLARDSRYARIMEVMEDAQQRRPAMRKLADRLGAWYTPFAVTIGVIAAVASGDPIRFLAVMVIATPCPLLIAIPVALLGAISLAARRGIIIRDPRVLEQVDKCRVLVLDKTGTLTLGRPALTTVHTSDLDGDDVIRLTASAEAYSKHPLARAVIAEAEKRGLTPAPASAVREPPGQGLVAEVDDRTVRITSRSALAREDHPAVALLPDVEAGLECVVLVDDVYGATLRFRDEPREESRPFVAHLGPHHRFERVLLVSGDRRAEVEYLADLVGIDEIWAEQSPEDKVKIVEEQLRFAPTLFVGDGVNDAPALMTATVGVAFGQAHDITAEAAGAVLMNPTLVALDELFHIAKRLRRIALQSAGIGMTLSVGGMAFAAFGMLTPVAGAILQEGIDLIAVLNALRVSVGVGELSDFDAVVQDEHSGYT